MSIDPPDWHNKNKGKLEQAFQKALEEKQQKQTLSSKEKNSRGSDMIQKDKPHPMPRPKGVARMMIDRQTYNRTLAVERSRQTDTIKKARAAADDIKKRMPSQKQQSSKSLTDKSAKARWQKDIGSTSKKLDEAITKAKAEKDHSQSQNILKSKFNTMPARQDHER